MNTQIKQLKFILDIQLFNKLQKGNIELLKIIVVTLKQIEAGARLNSQIRACVAEADEDIFLKISLEELF